MTEFGQLLLETARACQGRSCVVLDRVLTAKVRAWADDQIAIEKQAIGSVEIPPAEPFTSSERDAGMKAKNLILTVAATFNAAVSALLLACAIYQLATQGGLFTGGGERRIMPITDAAFMLVWLTSAIVTGWTYTRPEE